MSCNEDRVDRRSSLAICPRRTSAALTSTCSSARSAGERSRQTGRPASRWRSCASRRPRACTTGWPWPSPSPPRTRPALQAAPRRLIWPVPAEGRLEQPLVRLVAAAAVLIALAAGTFAWVEARARRADPPQVAAVAAMMTPGSSPAKSLRAGEHMVIAGQELAVRAYVMNGSETIVATSARPFSVPRSSHVLSGPSPKAWMATKGRLSMYGVNRPGGKQSMFLVSVMPMAELPEVAAHLGLI